MVEATLNSVVITEVTAKPLAEFFLGLGAGAVMLSAVGVVSEGEGDKGVVWSEGEAGD